MARDLGDLVGAVIRPPHREDEVLPRTGGPAGNARLTAWLGMALLVLFLVEGVTLLSLNDMVAVHIIVGTIAVPIALAKTASTGWRILRYYTGNAAYRRAGPPPLGLRILGPVVIVTSLAVLGTGLALVALGHGSFTPIVTVAGTGITAVGLHKAAFIAWFAVTTVHVLTRLVPAATILRDERRRRAPGTSVRAAVVSLSIAVGIVAGVVVLDLSHEWTNHSLAGTEASD